MPKGTPRSVQEPLIAATILTLQTAGNVAALVQGIFNHVPQGQARPYLVVENFVSISWNTMNEYGYECTLDLRAVSEAAGDQECARILDAAIQDLNYSKPALTDPLNPAISTFRTVSYKRDHEWKFKEELIGGVLVRHHVVTMRVFISQPS